MKKTNEEDGVWRTVGGRRIFIRKGQNLSEAMIESGKFKKNGFLGKEFLGVKGKEAIDKLLEEKTGHVKGAFSREDIGDIDLIWGNSAMGLQHIIERRIKTKQNLEKVLTNLDETITNGVPKLSRNKDGKLKIILEYKDQRAIIGTEIQNESIQFVLTLYEIYK